MANSVFQYTPEKNLEGTCQEIELATESDLDAQSIEKIIVKPDADLGRVVRSCTVLLEINLVNILALKYQWLQTSLDSVTSAASCISRVSQIRTRYL